ncbi:MAG: DUF1684 domain-containing protein [Bacteroidia bacterium]
MKRNLPSRALIFILIALLFIVSCTPKEVTEHQTKVTTERATKNNEFLMGGSPITEEDLKSFSGLKYFPINYDYNLQGNLIPFPNPQKVILEQGDTVKEMLRYGKVSFEFMGKSHELTVFKYIVDELSEEEGELFVPFFDNTNGINTYDGGRYVYPVNQGDGTVAIDFNLASNPYCAYNHKYNCVVPPLENSLSIEIKAGEKSYH